MLLQSRLARDRVPRQDRKSLFSNARSPPMSAEMRLKERGIVLSEPQSPSGNYLPFRLHENTLYLSGQGPRLADGSLRAGIVGANVTLEEAKADARLVGLGLLAVARQALGSLDRIDYVVKLLGMVNAAPGFGHQPEVINGCSDLFVEVFGEAGRHARSAVGMGSLPRGITVEIEAIFAIKK
jgi:enamine deaminase RidA (YjgF/YER057c/UK114 family)